jgi:hypothetical protein
LDDWTFGITMTIVGAGGTLLTLWIIALTTRLLERLFPVPEPSTDGESGARKKGVWQ